LGYYLAARLLWNSDEDVDAIKTDFFTSAFGHAAEPMTRFYDLIDGGQRPLLSEHLLAAMYHTLHEALAAADDDDVRRRIEQLALYTRYVDLFRDYHQDRSPQR